MHVRMACLIRFYVQSMRAEYVQRPTEARMRVIKTEFAKKGFVNCLGAIDGVHVKIQQPKYLPNYEDYYCVRKGCSTVQMQTTKGVSGM